MGENSTCKPCCMNYDCMSKHDWCQFWRPPPFPENLPKITIEWIRKNPAFLSYKERCGIEFPEYDTTKTPTVTHTTTAVTTLSSILTTTPAATAGGTIALIVILVLVIIALGLACLYFLWKRHKKRTGSINSLPMQKYENTNYLDNKARDNHSWKESQNQLTTDLTCKGTSYGSLPPPNGAPQYVKGENKTSDEVKVESPRDFDQMNSSVKSEQLAYDNENFDKNGKESPGANSQTPLFDTTDGSALPNVPTSQSTSINDVNQTDKKHDNGVVKLPPIDITKTSITGSPKKKKPLYLQRKSNPVKGIEDISHDMAGNRKSY